MADFGYDVADYCGIEPMFGTLEDFDRLLAAAHARGLKLLLDFVPNHSSDQHPWFVESRSSRDNPKRDWYIWRDAIAGPDGERPAEQLDQRLRRLGLDMGRGDRAILPARLPRRAARPQLAHPELKAAMLDVLRFWFERGVDGFRIDVLWHIVKAEGLPDNPPNPAWRPGRQRARPGAAAAFDRPARGARDLGRDAPTGRQLTGSACWSARSSCPTTVWRAGTALRETPQVHLPFNFALIENAWDAETLGQLIAEYEASMPAVGLAQLGASAATTRRASPRASARRRRAWR